MSTYRKARVVAVHPASGTVDIVFLDNGQRAVNVEVMRTASNHGCSWKVPNIPPPSSEASAARVETNLRSMVAWVGWCYGRPVITGFSRPANGITPTEQDRWLDVHDASGGFMTFAPDGTYEVFIPGGAYLRIGTGAHADISLSAGELATNGPAEITVTLATSQGTLSLDPSGAWKLTGASLEIDCDTTIKGSLTVTEDATIGGKQFLPHEHTDVQSGSGNTGPVA